MEYLTHENRTVHTIKYGIDNRPHIYKGRLQLTRFPEQGQSLTEWDGKGVVIVECDVLDNLIWKRPGDSISLCGYDLLIMDYDYNDRAAECVLDTPENQQAYLYRILHRNGIEIEMAAIYANIKPKRREVWQAVEFALMDE